MTDQAAEARELDDSTYYALVNAVTSRTVRATGPGGIVDREGLRREINRLVTQWVDALSVRLAQECALRAQAEQERDQASRSRNEWKQLACDWDAEAHRQEVFRHQVEARLREYEEALRLSPCGRELAGFPKCGTDAEADARLGKCSRCELLVSESKA